MKVDLLAALAQVRAAIDTGLNWLVWLAGSILALIVLAKVAAAQGYAVPFIRYSLSNIELLYLAGAWWLLKR